MINLGKISSKNNFRMKFEISVHCVYAPYGMIMYDHVLLITLVLMHTVLTTLGYLMLEGLV